MLKLGRMCHCQATLWKWNASGVFQWRRKRGANQSAGVDQKDYMLLLDGTDIYTAGSFVSGQDEGVVIKWDESSGPPSLAWHSDRNGGTEVVSSAVRGPHSRMCVATDGYLHVALTDLFRYDTSNGDRTATIGAELITGYVYPGPSGSVFALSNPGGVASSSIFRANTAYTITHQITASLGQTINDLAQVDASTLCMVGALPFSKKLRTLDVTLTEIASFIEGTPSQVPHRIVTFGSNAYAWEQTTARFAKYDLAGITRTWTNTTMSSAGAGYTAGTGAADARNALMALDSSENLYTVMHTASTDPYKIQQRDPADGSINWETDIGVTTIRKPTCIALTDSLLVLIGAWYDGASSTDPKTIVALDPTDGSILWSHLIGDPAADQDLHDVRIDADDNVYAAGWLVGG